jgi:hypothetical protein
MCDRRRYLIINLIYLLILHLDWHILPASEENQNVWTLIIRLTLIIDTNVLFYLLCRRYPRDNLLDCELTVIHTCPRFFTRAGEENNFCEVIHEFFASH